MFKIKDKPGTAMTEVAIGTALAAVVLLVAIGLFNDNVAEMISNSNLSNVFNGNSKTEYSAFNRDYSKSQINVQIMGEQGLGMLRRKANNKAIEQIDQAIKGTDTSAKNINSIAYLTVAIKAIVGKPDVCVYMKKDSDKFCNEDEIGGYTYKINVSSSTLTIKKVDVTGNNVIETKTLTISNPFDNVVNNVTIPINEEHRSKFNTKEKYDFIKALSSQAESIVYDHVILIRTIQTFESTEKTAPPTDVLTSLTGILDKLKNKAREAYVRCYCYHIFGIEICSPVPRLLSHSGCNGATVSNSDKTKINNWAKELATSLSTSVNEGNNSTQLITLFKDSMDSNNILDILNDDVTNSVTACSLLVNSLVEFSNQYGLSLSNLDITETSSQYTITKGGQTCTASTNSEADDFNSFIKRLFGG